MKFSILILTIGIPGSGKSTWVEEYHRNYPRSIVISTDVIRKELTGVTGCNPAQNSMMHEEARRRVKAILEDPQYYTADYPLGPTIVVDSTNCDPAEWVAYKRLGASIYIAKIFPVAPEEAMKRQIARGRVVPMDVLQSKWDSYIRNKDRIPKLFNMVL